MNFNINKSLSVDENTITIPVQAESSIENISMEVATQIGATNCVTGEFTTGDAGSTKVINVPYNGNGYPVGIMIVVAEGMMAEPWITILHRYAIGGYFLSKAIMDASPDYAEGDNDVILGVVFYKSNASIPAALSASPLNFHGYSQDAVTDGKDSALFVHSATEIEVSVSDTRYGLLENTTYKYCVWYSE